MAEKKGRGDRKILTIMKISELANLRLLTFVQLKEWKLPSGCICLTTEVDGKTGQAALSKDTPLSHLGPAATLSTYLRLLTTSMQIEISPHTL